MGVDVASEGVRQLERATRLLEVQASAPTGSRRPVHKALEQLFSEARGRAQSQGALAAAVPLSGVGADRLLQETQLLERAVADFSLAPAAGAGAGRGDEALADRDTSSLGIDEFFGLRRELVLQNIMEEAHRDAMRSFERHSVDKIQADWEASKAKILASLNPHRAAPSALSAAAVAAVAGGQAPNASAQAALSGRGAEAPPQDAAIVAALAQPLSQALVVQVGQLSCDACPAYRGELMECWGIVSHILERSPRAGLCGALRYLQSRYAEELRAVVYRASDARLGGVPDAWSLIAAFGRVKFETAAFPSAPAHVWYAAYVAARAGFSHLLRELPDRAAPLAGQCPMLRNVCDLMAGRLEAAAGGGRDFAPAVLGADRADLLRAALSEDSGIFHDVLVALLSGRPFAFGRLPEGTVEDWLWFRLHAVQIACGDSDQAPEFEQQLEKLQRQVCELPPSHYDPSPGSAAVVGGGVAAGGGISQTLNFVKVLLLTAQLPRAIRQLSSQDRALRGPAVHMALVLRASGAGGAALAPSDEADVADGETLDVAGLVCDYASQFKCGHQLQYFKLLEPAGRARALQKLLLSGGVGTNEELLGHIDANGRHRQGLLEQALQADGLGGEQAEFVDLCARAGRSALERGQYREALRLLHLGRCHAEVLQVLCRCLRLPIWRDPAACADEAATALGQDVQRFFAIYERNLDRYALASSTWAVARKLYAIRMFHALCDRGQPEAALDLFDRERLLPFDGEAVAAGEVGDEVAGEYPRVVANFVRILKHAVSQGAVASGALQARIRELQTFLAVHSHRLVVDHETTALLATLTLY